MKTALVALAMLAGFALPCHAAGINLSWDDCGNAGVRNRSFACDDNQGPPFELIGSFTAPSGVLAFWGEEIVVDFLTCSPLPDWWHFFSTGNCRQTAISASVDFVTDSLGSCEDYWAGSGSGGITRYVSPYPDGASGRGRILMLFTVPTALARPLEEGREYFGFRLRVSRANTVGPGACAGCGETAIFVLNEIKLVQTDGGDVYRLQNPGERNWVSWQGDELSHPSMCYVPTRNSTWGAIKAQYR